MSATSVVESLHRYQDLILLFEQTFYQAYNTRLIKGEGEPVYLPQSDACSYNQIIFAHGYYRSALHEISHWCIAGKERRMLEDFGYWYQPDGRNEEQQAAFELVEVKPQAIEWAFCVAAGISFNVSADNLNGCGSDRAGFTYKVYHQVKEYLVNGFPERAQQFIDAIAVFYQTSMPLQIEDFVLDKDLYPDV